jgi:hypothetical protein
LEGSETGTVFQNDLRADLSFARRQFRRRYVPGQVSRLSLPRRPDVLRPLGFFFPRPELSHHKFHASISSRAETAKASLCRR